MKLLSVGLLIIVLAATVLTSVVWIEHRQAEANSALLEDTGSAEADSGVAVIAHSRSGNTAVLGRHIAKREGAAYFRLEAADYRLGFMGLFNALRDARSREAVITPESLDLSGYETVYLGSPIWLYSPSPPLWAFASRNDFSGKKVVLFNTFNSRFEPEYIDAFERVVRERGAASFAHQYFNRGRMTRQLSTAEMLQRFDEIYMGE